jgi:3-hydroxyacyl-CoA dehydrogenase
VLAVVGAGSTGAQIAQQAALHGVEVRLQDVTDDRFRPSSALEAKVRAGELGRKNGPGWYVHSQEQGA